MKQRTALLSLVCTLVLSACGQDVTGPGATDPPTSEGVVVGRLDGSSSSPSPSFSHSFSASSARGDIKVAVARVKGTGTLEVLASASAAADGSYRIEKVPAGVDRLVVVAASSSGAEIGRVILHQAAPVGQITNAAPINDETTVEAKVFGEMIRSGLAKENINTVELAQSIEFGSAESAKTVAGSASDVTALANAARARQEIYSQVLATRGVSLDSKARFEAAVASATAYAEERHAGADEKSAEARAAASVADAYTAKGAKSSTQAEASGAAETGFLKAVQVTNANAKLDLERAAVKLDLVARERNISELLSSLGVSAAQTEAAKSALAAARAAADTASSTSSLSEGANRASGAVQTAFEGHLTQSGRVPQLALDQIKAAFNNLPSGADLKSRLDSAATASAVASAYTAHSDAVRTAVQSAVAQFAAAGGSLDGKATADLFVALRGLAQSR